MTRLRIVELPHPRGADGRYVEGPTPFMLVMDRVTNEEALIIGAHGPDLSEMVREVGARGAMVFRQLSVDIPGVDTDDMI